MWSTSESWFYYYSYVIKYQQKGKRDVKTTSKKKLMAKVKQSANQRQDAIELTNDIGWHVWILKDSLKSI